MMTDLIGGLWDDGSDAAVAKTGLDRAGLVGLITANTVRVAAWTARTGASDLQLVH